MAKREILLDALTKAHSFGDYKHNDNEAKGWREGVAYARTLYETVYPEEKNEERNADQPAPGLSGAN